MKKLIHILICVMSSGIGAWGQEVKTLPAGDTKTGTTPQQEITSSTEMSSLAVCPDESVLEISPATGSMRPDSLHLPRLNSLGKVPISLYPLSWGGLYSWDLHEGLNVNIGASVFASFGKHAPHGAGFLQNIAAMYAVPLTDRLSIAVGGYLNNMYWDSRQFRDGGLNAVLGYKFDEHWEAYLYGQKSILNKRRMPVPPVYLNDIGDRIGAAVKYNFSPSFSIQVSVEEHR